MTNIKYRPEIDGLRAIAVISVIIYHANFIFAGDRLVSGGYLGVDIFFVISGYLITSIILKGLSQGNFSFAEFYERRARRILPALFVVILTITPVACILFVPWQLLDYSKSVFSTLFFVSNIFFWKQSGYFAADADQMPLLHTWSLSIEEQFYILFPLFLVLLWRYLHRFIVPVFIIGIILSLYLANSVSSYQPESSFYLLPTRMWELLCGAVLARTESAHGRKTLSVKLDSAISIICLAIIIACFFIFNADTLHPGYLTSITVVGTMGLIWFLKPEGSITKLLSLKPIVFTGLISYSLYLWHFPFFSFTDIKVPDAGVGLKILLIIVSVILSVISYYFIEQPVRKRRLNLKYFLSFCSATMTGLVLFSGVVYITDGGLGRYNQQDLALISKSPDEFGLYVRTRFNELHEREFEDNDKIKLLIIGDSYAQDLVNAIFETGINSNFTISTYRISARCGNLYLHYDFSEKIAARDKVLCSSYRDYNDESIQQLMKRADTIWIASSWRDWHVELLPESLSNIQDVTNASLLVFGRKNFGEFTINQIIDIPEENRANYRHKVTDSHWQTNEKMKSVVNEAIMVDLQKLLCDGLETCPVFDTNNSLISYDGYHLTQSGARFVGERLLLHPAIGDLLSDKQVE